MAAPLTTSPIAQMVPHPRDVQDRAQLIPWGVCVHTTGGGVPVEAEQRGVDPMAIAIETYMRPDDPAHNDYAPFPHYVIGNDGTIIQIADERERARHVLISDEDRAAYLSGDWRNRVGSIPLGLWDQRWPGKKNPLNLFPSRHPNEDYIGVELIPLLEPEANGSLFTAEQYDRLGELLEDIEDRYTLKLEGSRLVGHEDLSPLTRWVKRGGWDPGALCPQPSFFWDEIKNSSNFPFVT